MKPILVSSGEPAGIGPDLCLALSRTKLPVVVMADKALLQQRAQCLGMALNLLDYEPGKNYANLENALVVYNLPTKVTVEAQHLNPDNAPYVINMLSQAADACFAGEFSALVTAPVHKAVINQAGIDFTGHTEFLAEHFGIKRVVMMLACEVMKVALVTTHQPLSTVPASITKELLMEVIAQVHHSFMSDFAIAKPRIFVSGLNPHAGEGGYLGREEIEIIAPSLERLRVQGIDVHGPFAADTLFTPQYLQQADVFVAMYHDQGLAVLKYASFGQAVNITLGLPIIRTSVDHGTALSLAGTGQANPGSLIAAITEAKNLVTCRAQHVYH